MYLLKLALRPWRLAMLSQVFSALAVGVLLLMVGFLFWMQQGLKSVLVRLQGEQVLTAYISSAVPVDDESKLIESVRRMTNGQGNVDIKLVDSAGFLKLVKNQYPDLERELSGLGSDLQQVVPRYISISGILPRSILDQIKNLPGIESAESSKDRYSHIVGAFSTLRWVVRVLMIGVALALFTGLIHLSKMNSYLHRDALGLLKFWGASNGTLAVPGMISGLMVGLLGGFIAWAGWITLGVELTQHVRSLSTILKEIPIGNPHFELILFLAGAVVGQMTGILGGRRV